ncbi:hypothetical protein ACVW17_003241 [Bradyrhizobium sp. USDA 4473]
MQVLMGDRKPNPILAQFREHVRERERREALKFVDVYEELSPTSRRTISARVRCEPDHGDKEPTKQGRGVVSDPTLCKVYDEDLAIIHRLPKTQVLLRGG